MSNRVRWSELSRHEAAVARTLQWADGSAARGDYADALGWIQVVEAVDGGLSEEYIAKRDAWLRRLNADEQADESTGARS